MIEVHKLEEFISKHEKELEKNRLFNLLGDILREIKRLMPFLLLDDSKFNKVMPKNITRMMILKEIEDLRRVATEYVEFMIESMNMRRVIEDIDEIDDTYTEPWYEIIEETQQLLNSQDQPQDQ